ncbi:hypothetical protein BBD42_11465 [Paenibacillus sp. BIHB 4019]|uniref:Ankyrin repeat domain-containing protein n=1 Tax=Paenibacillus sp. BIHB 4019 TaxID=1870819 RepID=A0A1B2DH65_9BACL|nr:hypothetical protein [Paenibacillus sp. BIHB 4019]ANY67015.1 hypothetical protein BBD42_11465 [Paenibacillus sp. BIHB 4019]
MGLHAARITAEEASYLSNEYIKQFVRAAHMDFDKVKQMLSEEPELLHASCDWGDGDWENALGAAAHVGRRDIALYLLERGARLDLFAAAMLGKLEVVHAILSDDPAAKDAIGPHGIPLIVHAKMGGEESRLVYAYLESLQA